MSDPIQARRFTLTFLWLLLAVTATTELLVVGMSTLIPRETLLYFGVLVSWSPGIAALLASLWLRRDLKLIGWHWPSWSVFSISYITPLSYGLAAYLFVWISGLGGFYNETGYRALIEQWWLGKIPAAWQMTALIITSATLGIVRGCVTSLGEEIGWRGFLVPEMSQFLSYRATALGSGLIWSVWHYPLILAMESRFDWHSVYCLVCFTFVITAMGFPLAWIRLKSGDVWSCAIFHASHNLFILHLFNPLTIDTGSTRWFTSEFGAALVVTTAITAWFFRNKPSTSRDS